MERFNSTLSTKGFLPKSNLNWEEFRKVLNPILGEGENSLEDKLDSMVGDLGDYKDANILAAENPQARLDELVTRVEDAFSRLNNFYVALGRSSLQYRAAYRGLVNGLNGKSRGSQPVETRLIVSFALQRSEANDRGGNFEIIPTDENGDTFTTHSHETVGMDSDFFGASQQDKLGNQVSGYSVSSEGTCSEDELLSTFSLFAQALVKLRTLRNNLEKTQQRFDSINRINESTAQHRELIKTQLEKVGKIEF